MPSKTFEDLEVWQDAKAIVVTVYRVTDKPPASRDFGFKGQIQRAAVSFMSNIAEGFGRGGNREFIQFLYIAEASAGEVRSLVHVAGELGYMAGEDKVSLLARLTTVSRQLGGFIKYLERDLTTKSKAATS